MSGNTDEGQAPLQGTDGEEQNGVENDVQFTANEISPTVAKPKGNAYINFIQAFHRRYKNNTNMKTKDLVRRGAAVWRSMSDAQKKPYVEMAAKAKTKRASSGYKEKRRRRQQRKTMSTGLQRRREPYSVVNAATFSRTSISTTSSDYTY